MASQPYMHFALPPSTCKKAIVHIGAGTGYYTAVLAELVVRAGQVFAYEIEPELAQWAPTTLADLPNVTVYPRSGAEAPLPICDVVHINAGATAPLDIWLDALRPSWRLLFPLTPDLAADMPGPGA